MGSVARGGRKGCLGGESDRKEATTSSGDLRAGEEQGGLKAEVLCDGVQGERVGGLAGEERVGGKRGAGNWLFAQDVQTEREGHVRVGGVVRDGKAEDDGVKLGEVLEERIAGIGEDGVGMVVGGFWGVGGDDERSVLCGEGDGRGSATRPDKVDLDSVGGVEGGEGGEVGRGREDTGAEEGDADRAVAWAVFVGGHRAGVGQWRDVGDACCAACDKGRGSSPSSVCVESVPDSRLLRSLIRRLCGDDRLYT